MNNLRALQRSSLYMLKRAYGGPIDIYKLVDAQTDVRTGVKTSTVNVFHVRRAIFMPVTTRRKALLRKMAAGSFDVGDGEIIVDRADVPANLRLTAEDWIVHESRKYPVKTVEEFEMGGWIITVGELVGEVPAQIFDIKGESNINVAGEA